MGFISIEYQNKEKESTFNLRRISFGARTYNASIGRFDRVDPLAEKRVWLTPYNFVKNNPLNRIDPNGALDEACCGDDPSDDPFLFAKLAVTAFYDTKHAVYNTALRAFGSDLRAGYKVENGEEVFETEFTRKPVDNSFKGAVKETVSAVMDVVSIIPGGSTEGKLLAQTSKSQTSRAVKAVIDEKRVGHIFREAEGHFAIDTPNARNLIESTANNSNNVLGTDKYGNQWSAKTQQDGTQIWTQSRNGKIINAGQNQEPRQFNTETGLSAPVKPNQQ